VPGSDWQPRGKWSLDLCLSQSVIASDSKHSGAFVFSLDETTYQDWANRPEINIVMAVEHEERIFWLIVD
jgi:hypothetical protein